MENQVRALGDGGGRPLLQIHGQREWQKHAATVWDGRHFHRATAAAVTMDLGLSSSLGGGELEAEDRAEERQGVAAADGD